MKSFLLLIIFILSTKPGFSKDAKDCVNIDHPATQNEYRACLRMNIKVQAHAQGVDCENCFVDQNEKESNGIVAAIGALAQPAAYLLATVSTAKFQNKTQEKWANTFKSGYQECTNRYTSFLNYNTAIGANPILPPEAQALNESCNGFGYGSYAGYGGLVGNMYGGFSNPFLQNGFSSGYLSGFGGPFGASATGNGMLSGSIGIGSSVTSGSATSQSGITPAFGF